MRAAASRRKPRGCGDPAVQIARLDVVSRQVDQTRRRGKGQSAGAKAEKASLTRRATRLDNDLAPVGARFPRVGVARACVRALATPPSISGGLEISGGR